MQIVDMTMLLSDRTPAFPSHPVKIALVKSMTRGSLSVGDLANVSLLLMTTHVGTHIDAPFHQFPDGKKLYEYPIERFIGKGVILDIPKGELEEITAEDLERAKPSVCENDIVLIHTGWEQNWCKEIDYILGKRPGLTEDAANWLVKRDINMVGMDTIAPQHPKYAKAQAAKRIDPVHEILLSNDKLIIECLTNMTPALGKRSNRIEVVPLRVEAPDGAQVRVLVFLDD